LPLVSTRGEKAGCLACTIQRFGGRWAVNEGSGAFLGVTVSNDAFRQGPAVGNLPVADCSISQSIDPEAKEA